MANKSWTIPHRGKFYTFELNKLKVSADHRAELVRVLKEAKTAAGHAAKGADIELVDHVIGLLGTGAEISTEAIAELGEFYDGVNQVMNGQEGDAMAANTNTDIERIKEMNKIAADPDGRIALQRAATGQDLDARQAATVQRYKALELAHNEQARHEQHSPGGWMRLPDAPLYRQ